MGKDALSQEIHCAFSSTMLKEICCSFQKSSILGAVWCNTSNVILLNATVVTQGYSINEKYLFLSNTLNEHLGPNSILIYTVVK